MTFYKLTHSKAFAKKTPAVFHQRHDYYTEPMVGTGSRRDRRNQIPPRLFEFAVIGILVVLAVVLACHEFSLITPH